jgi:hypothetical protein
VSPDILAKYVGRYEGIWLDNPTRVEVTFENGVLLLSRNGGEKNQLIGQSDTTFVCPTCQWGQPYTFTRQGDGMATEIREVQVSGAWIFKRVE